MGRDGGLHVADAGVEVAELGRAETGPEAQLRILRRQLAGLAIEAGRVIVTALVEQVIGLRRPGRRRR